MPERNLFGRFQDIVAGPPTGPSNLELLAAFLKSITQIPGAGTRVPPVQAGATTPQILGAAARGMGADIGAGIRGMGTGLAELGRGALAGAQTSVINPIQQLMGPAQAAPTLPGTAQLQTPIQPTTQPTTTEEPQKESDTQRKLLATALQIGLPLALAGFGGRQGLAMGAGLAGGLGQMALQKQKQELFNQMVPTFSVDSETGEPVITGQVPRLAKRAQPPKETKTSKLREVVKTQIPTTKEAGKPEATKIQRMVDRANELQSKGVGREEAIKRAREEIK